MDTEPPPTNNSRATRVFIGLKIAPEIAQELAQIARRLERYSVRLVPVEDIHLTLVPPWRERNIPGAIDKLHGAISNSASFLLTFDHVAYGPTRRRPRLLWAECATCDDILGLRNALLETFGQSDEQSFRPHVTLARIRSGGAAIVQKIPMDQKLSLTQRIDSVEIFQSPPSGESGYRVLASLPLGDERNLVSTPS